MTEYVERRDSSLYLTGSRVPLASIAGEYRGGESPEAIRAHFPTLTLEQVYGAIAFYLHNSAEADLDLQERDRIEREFAASHVAPAELKRRLDLARHESNRHP